MVRAARSAVPGLVFVALVLAGAAGALATPVPDGAGGFVSEQPGLRVHLPGHLGEAPVRLLFPDGARIDVASAVRLVRRSDEGEVARLDVGEGEGAVEGATVVYRGALAGADLRHTVEVDRLKTALVLAGVPEGMAPGGAGGEVVLEERVILPRGWRLPGLSAGGTLVTSLTWPILDATGAERARLGAPVVFERSTTRSTPGHAAPAHAELVLGFDGVLVVRTVFPAAWLVDAARSFPVVIDPTIIVSRPAEISADPTAFDVTPDAHHWNVVALTSATATADWEFEVGGVVSVDAPPACDVLVADGNQGGIPGTTGEARTVAGGGVQATIEHAAVDQLAVGQNVTFAWTAERVVHAWELDVTSADTQRPQRLSIDGPAGLRWMLFEPGSSSGWSTSRDASYAESVSATAQTVRLRDTGYWCLVLCADSGAGKAGAVTIRWEAPPPAIQLIEGQPVLTDPAAVNALWQPFEVAPRATSWNAVVAVATDPGDDWDVQAGTATSSKSGPQSDFLVFDGRQGPVTPTAGAILVDSAITVARVELADVHAAPFGVSTTATWAADDVALVFEVDITTPGAQQLYVDGPGYLEWYVVAPQSTAEWQSVSGYRAKSSGTTPERYTFSSAGVYAVVVVAHASVPVQAGQVTIGWVPPRMLTQGQPERISDSELYGITPQAGAWNAVAVLATDPGDDWDITMGSAGSARFNPDLDFLVFDGNLGTVSPTADEVLAYSASFPALLEHADTQRTALGQRLSAPWAADDVISVLEVDVQTAGVHDVVVDGPAGLLFGVFEPTAGAGWFSRGGAASEHPVGATPVSVDFHSPGVWALCVFTDAGVNPPAGTVVLSFPGSVSGPSGGVTSGVGLPTGTAVVVGGANPGGSTGGATGAGSASATGGGSGISSGSGGSGSSGGCALGAPGGAAALPFALALLGLATARTRRRRRRG
jgi:hypothetical protein